MSQMVLTKMPRPLLVAELSESDKKIGRISILTEDQNRLQTYALLEIQYPDKYRPKLPTSGENELKSNILMAKKLGSNPDTSSMHGASSKYSNAQSVVARLTSNPPPVIRH